MHFQCEDGTYVHESVGAWMLLNGIKINIEVWNKLYRLDFLRKNEIHAIHRIFEDNWLSCTMWLYAKIIQMVSAITLNYNLRDKSIVTSIIGQKGTDDSARDLCDDVIQLRKLIDRKFRHVDGAYDLYYANIKLCLMNLVSSIYTEKQVSYIKSHLRNAARKVPSIKLLHSNRYRFIYLCSCIYDNGYSFYHYDVWYTKLHKYLPILFKE